MSAISTSGLFLFPRISFALQARSAEPHLFLQLRTSGGLDSTLGLDPQEMPKDGTEKDIFLEYGSDDIIRPPGLPDLKFGPAASQALLSIASTKCPIAVLNGVMMRRDAGHEVLLQYMSSGKGDNSAADLPAELAATYGAGDYGVFFTGNINTGSRGVVLTTPQDILNESGGAASLSQILKPINPTQDQLSPLSRAIRSIISSEVTTEKLVKTFTQIKENYPNESDEIKTLLAAFVSGASQQAILDIAPEANLDTHQDHPKVHLAQQKMVWEKVANLVSLFNKIKFGNGSLLNHTTIMVISEFSRTPFLNAAKGKDHNTDTNSVLFLGKGINNGKTIGKSNVIIAKKSQTGVPLHIAAAMDMKTGQPLTKPPENPKNASFIFPENVIRTVAELFGNPKGFSSVDPNLAVLKDLIKT